MQDQQADLVWRAGDVPVSVAFDDPYFSLEDGLAETRHVFLSGNDLPERFRDGFHIAELGFGTGLNLLAALQAWRAAAVPGRLRYTSFEAFPMAPDDMRRAQARFAGLTPRGRARPPLDRRCAGDRAARSGLRACGGRCAANAADWPHRADAWFLDGFSPARNPELWQPCLMAEVARHTAPGGTAATYTAAGFVRRGLAEAGFAVRRVAGYGRKRHMTRARLAGP